MCEQEDEQLSSGDVEGGGLASPPAALFTLES